MQTTYAVGVGPAPYARTRASTQRDRRIREKWDAEFATVARKKKRRESGA
jgi:hypothetical protein